ncbi:Mitochondrial carrier protein PET8 [Metarhizium guizhouense ARSEF 977]|uniref:Mitochondrial carrier protein PET8 n=1 Tax=Metarhizium guizhouense (strain ARSEF 977) TaxID=1276136 RepID=A0A0B4HEL9_METGA|nr:Mitochondrial carrier protein PET8 [Metarhizium guizhouense ARSEF 977]
MMSARSAAGLGAMRAASRRTCVVGRGFRISTSTRLGLKESSSRMCLLRQCVRISCEDISLLTVCVPRVETDADYDRHKRDSLAKQKKGAGHWKPELASDSEEAVKADRASSGREDISRLQERTKRSAEESSRSGTSVRDGM